MAADKVATYAVNLESNAAQVAAVGGASLETYRKQIEQSQDAIKGASAALKALRGSSDEVAAAKDKLKAKIDAERGALSQANLALLKQGTTYTKVAAEAKKTRDASKAFTDGIKAGGGPVADLTSKIEGLKSVAAGGAGGLALVTAGAVALVAGVAALGAAVFEAGVKLGRFVLEGANSLRSMNLMREAASGSAQNAKNLGTQVDALSRKVATSKVELNAMAVALTKSLSGGVSKASGQAIVDTFAAIAQGTAAAGEETGSKIREIIERSKQIGRISIDPRELQGTRLKFSEIAEALAKNMGVSLEKARLALFQGRVKLEDGAKALRTVVEGKFGDINARKLLDFDVQFQKLQEHLVGLTKGVVLEPLLKGLSQVLEKFDATSVTGQAIGAAFTKIGAAISGFALKNLDGVVKGIEQMVLWGVRAVEVFSVWAPRIAGVVSALTQSEAVMLPVKGALIGIGVVIGTVAAAFAAAGVVIAATAAFIGAPFLALWKGYQLVKGISWSDLGKGIVDGLVGGIVGGAEKVVGAVTGLASKMTSAFKGALGIHSPSLVFERDAGQVPAGAARGIQKGAPAVQRAADDMAPRPRSSGGAAPTVNVGPGGGGGPIIINFMIPESAAGGRPADVARAIAEPSILSALTRAVRQGLVSQGIPTQAEVA